MLRVFIHTHTRPPPPSPLREYNDWIMVKLQHMAELVKEAEDIIQREVNFIQTYPVKRILQEDAKELLKEADELVALQVREGRGAGGGGALVRCACLLRTS